VALLAEGVDPQGRSGSAPPLPGGGGCHDRGRGEQAGARPVEGPPPARRWQKPWRNFRRGCPREISSDESSPPYEPSQPGDRIHIDPEAAKYFLRHVVFPLSSRLSTASASVGMALPGTCGRTGGILRVPSVPAAPPPEGFAPIARNGASRKPAAGRVDRTGKKLSRHRARLRTGHRSGGNPVQPRRSGGLSRSARGVILAVLDLHAFYGKSHISQGVNLSVPRSMTTTTAKALLDSSGGAQGRQLMLASASRPTRKPAPQLCPLGRQGKPFPLPDAAIPRATQQSADRRRRHIHSQQLQKSRCLLAGDGSRGSRSAFQRHSAKINKHQWRQLQVS